MKVASITNNDRRNYIKNNNSFLEISENAIQSFIKNANSDFYYDLNEAGYWEKLQYPSEGFSSVYGSIKGCDNNEKQKHLAEGFIKLYKLLGGYSSLFKTYPGLYKELYQPAYKTKNIAEDILTKADKIYADSVYTLRKSLKTLDFEASSVKNNKALKDKISQINKTKSEILNGANSMVTAIVDQLKYIPPVKKDDINEMEGAAYLNKVKTAVQEHKNAASKINGKVAIERPKITLSAMRLISMESELSINSHKLNGSNMFLFNIVEDPKFFACLENLCLDKIDIANSIGLNEYDLPGDHYLINPVRYYIYNEAYNTQIKTIADSEQCQLEVGRKEGGKVIPDDLWLELRYILITSLYIDNGVAYPVISNEKYLKLIEDIDRLYETIRYKEGYLRKEKQPVRREPVELLPAGGDNSARLDRLRAGFMALLRSQDGGVYVSYALYSFIFLSTISIKQDINTLPVLLVKDIANIARNIFVNYPATIKKVTKGMMNVSMLRLKSVILGQEAHKLKALAFMQFSDVLSTLRSVQSQLTQTIWKSPTSRLARYCLLAIAFQCLVEQLSPRNIENLNHNLTLASTCYLMKGNMMAFFAASIPLSIMTKALPSPYNLGRHLQEKHNLNFISYNLAILLSFSLSQIINTKFFSLAKVKTPNLRNNTHLYLSAAKNVLIAKFCGSLLSGRLKSFKDKYKRASFSLFSNGSALANMSACYIVLNSAGISSKTSLVVSALLGDIYLGFIERQQRA